MDKEIKKEELANPPAQSEEPKDEMIQEIEESMDVTKETLQEEQEEEFKTLKQG